MGKGACFIKAVLHMVNRFKQRKVMCSHFRLISSNEVQTVFRLSPSLFSQPCRFRRAVKSASFPPGEAKGPLRIRFGAFQSVFCAPRTPPPRLRAALLPFQGRFSRLPDGGAGSPQGLTEGVWFVEWKQLKATGGTPFAASRHFPQRGPQGSVRIRLGFPDWYSAYREPLRHAYARPSSALH